MRATNIAAGVLVVFVAASLLGGCSGGADPVLGRQCDSDLNAGYRELDLAKAKGFGGTVAWSKAASLLTAAKIQQQFDKFRNCVEKAGRARHYIRQSQVPR